MSEYFLYSCLCVTRVLIQARFYCVSETTCMDMRAHTHTQETDLLLWCITVANILSRSSGTFQETTSQKYHLSLTHTHTHLTVIWFDLIYSSMTKSPIDLTSTQWQSNCIMWRSIGQNSHIFYYSSAIYAQMLKYYGFKSTFSKSKCY